MGFGTQLVEQCNLFKAKEFVCVWVVLLSAENVKVMFLLCSVLKNLWSLR